MELHCRVSDNLCGNSSDNILCAILLFVLASFKKILGEKAGKQ